MPRLSGGAATAAAVAAAAGTQNARHEHTRRMDGNSEWLGSLNVDPHALERLFNGSNEEMAVFDMQARAPPPSSVAGAQPAANLTRRAVEIRHTPAHQPCLPLSVRIRSDKQKSRLAKKSPIHK